MCLLLSHCTLSLSSSSALSILFYSFGLLVFTQQRPPVAEVLPYPIIPIIPEIKLTVNPADSYHLKECKKHDGHYSSVMVHQLENIDSHLKRDMCYSVMMLVGLLSCMTSNSLIHRNSSQTVPAWHMGFLKGRLQHTQQVLTVPST